MNTTSKFSEALRGAFERPARGVVGLVDDLLRLCRQQGLQLDWQADLCRVRSRAAGSDEVIDKPLRKSVFRAILARLATLCNEQRPNSVSPYGGHGTLSIDTDPATFFRVSFANTPDEQWCKIGPLAPSAVTGEAGTILECLEKGPKTYSGIRRFLYLAGWETRSSETSRILDELLAEGLVELESTNGELRLTSYGRLVTDNSAAA